jgi:hypothetical protein
MVWPGTERRQEERKETEMESLLEERRDWRYFIN